MSFIRRAALAVVVVSTLALPASGQQGVPPFQIGQCGPSEQVGAAAAQRNQRIIAQMQVGDQVLVEVGNDQAWAIFRIGKPMACVIAVGITI